MALKSILKERQPSLVAYSKKRSMVDVSIKQSWGIVIHLNLFWKTAIAPLSGWSTCLFEKNK